MSEPMSSTEVEDVLSSIRRLVSEEFRPAHRPSPLAANTPEPGKLILTPALRVVQDTGVAPLRKEGGHDSAPASRTSANPLPIFIATRRVQVSPGTVPLSDQAEIAPIEKVVASLGAAVTARADEWEPEHGDLPPGGGFLADSWDQAPFAEVSVDLDEEPTHVMAETYQFIRSEPAIPAWAQDDQSVEILPEPIEDNAEIVQGTIEPDTDWADAAEASVIAALQAEADDAQARQIDEAEAETDSELRFNEDVLRELVRDILREELAGPMGERITRNIRKLVRAEIALLTAARELD